MEKFDTKKFVRTWIKAHNEKKGKMWVAETLGMEFGDVSNVSTGLRNRGVQLPPLHKGSGYLVKDTSVKELNEIIGNTARQMMQESKSDNKRHTTT